jgi:hypothetical protein
LTAPNECWAVDFMVDQLFNGRRLRVLTVVDICTRLCPAIHVAHACKGHDTVAAARSAMCHRPNTRVHWLLHAAANEREPNLLASGGPTMGPGTSKHGFYHYRRRGGAQTTCNEARPARATASRPPGSR